MRAHDRLGVRRRGRRAGNARQGATTRSREMASSRPRFDPGSFASRTTPPWTFCSRYEHQQRRCSRGHRGARRNRWTSDERDEPGPDGERVEAALDGVCRAATRCSAARSRSRTCSSLSLEETADDHGHDASRAVKAALVRARANVGRQRATRGADPRRRARDVRASLRRYADLVQRRATGTPCVRCSAKRRGSTSCRATQRRGPVGCRATSRATPRSPRARISEHEAGLGRRCRR